MRIATKAKMEWIDVKTKMVPEFLQWAVEAGDWGQCDVVRVVIDF